MKRKSLVGWLLAGCSVAFAARARGVVMPLAERTSVIDGRIADGEYDEGVTIGPFSRLHPILKWHRWDSEGDGTVTFMTDGRRLCVAWRVKAWSVDFDGSLKSGIVRRDGPIQYNNDAVELEIGAEENGRRAHFVINPNAVIYDAMLSVDGTADVSWNCAGVAAKCSLAHGWWLVELLLPLASVGVRPCFSGLRRSLRHFCLQSRYRLCQKSASRYVLQRPAVQLQQHR